MTFQRRLWFLSLAILGVLAVFSARILYWQMLRSRDLQAVALDPLAAAAEYARRGNATPQPGIDEGGSFQNLEDLPQPVLQRTIALLQSITRGSIYDRNGNLLAYDQLTEAGLRYRIYNDPSLAHTIGYTSALRTGLTGLERSYNDTLLGVNRMDAQLSMSLHQPITGSDLILTIDQSVQQAASSALGSIDLPGSVVVLDGSTGAVLALYSQPYFDPNRILEEGYAGSLLASGQAPFVNRATQSLYTPGSTFKTVTLIAALDTGQVTPETMFDFGEPIRTENGQYYVYEVDGGIIPDPNHAENRLSLPMAYAKSANAAFAKMGHEMAPNNFIRYAQRFGFSPEPGRGFPFEIEFSPAQLATDLDAIRNNNLLRAATAIGQGELLSSPMNVALSVLSVINNGDMPLPYFVEAVRSPTGSLNERLPNRRIYRNMMSNRTAGQVRSAMVTQVTEGGGYRAAVQGVTVGGKTGTAQLGGDQQPHAWFVGFADNGQQKVVIVVMIENGGSGAGAPAAIFAQIAPVALQAAALTEEVQASIEALPTSTQVPPPPTAVPPPTEAPAPEEAAPTEAPASTEAPVPEPTLPPAATETAQPQEVIPPPPQDAGPLPVVTVGGLPAPDIPLDPGQPDVLVDQASCPPDQNPPVGSGRLIWPSQYQALSGTDFTPDHPGLDLSAPPESNVFAADSGVVIFAGWTGAGYGNAVLIDHLNGYRTLYGHLSHVSVRCGQAVDAGRIVGQSGTTGNSTGPHLHFEVRVPGGFVNPLKVLPLP